jgi:hypothetical protein
MIARLDHRPMLTALLAISTTVLLVVVITLATLLITVEPPATTSSESGVGNPAAAVPDTDENYGSMWIAPNPTQKGASVAPHQDVPSAHYGL